MWRKNRSPNHGQPCAGVDLNRNTGFLWASDIGTSTDPCSIVFRGPSAFSEPESRNVRYLLDVFPVSWLMDVHAYSELILYPWGDDTNQSVDPAMNFMNPAYDGQRGNRIDPSYAEYMPAGDEEWFRATATAVRDGIAAVRDHVYAVERNVDLYPVTGDNDDYAYSRHFIDTSRRKVFAYTLETGREFQPEQDEAFAVLTEVASGLVAFCERALAAVPMQIMAVRRARTRIVDVGGVDDAGVHWHLSEEEAILAIRSEGRRFYVEQPEGDRVDVVIARTGSGREYLKTIADGDRPNNLLALPDLETQEAGHREGCGPPHIS